MAASLDAFSSMFSNPMVFTIILLWTLFWKAFSLWISARRGHRVWFVALLVLNTVGILDIIYIYFIGRAKGQPMKDVMGSLVFGTSKDSTSDIPDQSN